MDFILNGSAHGDVASRLAEHGFNPLSLRPYLSDCGRYTCISAMNSVTGKLEQKVIGNATTTLRKDAWKAIDDAVVKVAKPRLKAVKLIKDAGLVFTIPDGMGRTVLETETQSDINDASVSMDGLRENANDRPVYELGFLPLPIIHKDFSYSLRQIEASRNSGSALDTTSAELAATKVAEETEKMLLGTSTVADQYSFGGGKIYGLTDFPSRLTKTITAPTASGWNGTTFVQEIMAMMQQSRNAFHYGPWILLISSAWDQYLGDDYKAASDKTIRNRTLETEDLNSIQTVDYLSGFDVVLVQMTTNVVREVIGMDIITVAWDSHGGLKKNFKVMSIIVPQLRADQNGNTGIVHGSVV